MIRNRAALLIAFVAMLFAGLEPVAANPPEVRVELPGNSVTPLSETEVVLLNESQHPIYLNWMFPGSVALLERRSELTGEWEKGRGPIQCATVKDRTEPRKLPPASRLSLPIWWDNAVVDVDGVMVFKTVDGESTKLEGQFRITVHYALEPWTLGNKPSAILEAVSPPFEMKP